ncbi:UNVERIFIED_CONTAM: hypothetical protein FKN15_044032 [Acipenser sinensis]
MQIEDFHCVSVLGRGHFGKVSRSLGLTLLSLLLPGAFPLNPASQAIVDF